MAAFYEGFVTRYYKMPIALNLLLLATSAAFIIWYFVVYPAILIKRSKDEMRQTDAK
jgi:hypothetical protein